MFKINFHIVHIQLERYLLEIIVWFGLIFLVVPLFNKSIVCL